jgi:hypothetical protein
MISDHAILAVNEDIAFVFSGKLLTVVDSFSLAVEVLRCARGTLFTDAPAPGGARHDVSRISRHGASGDIAANHASI